MKRKSSLLGIAAIAAALAFSACGKGNNAVSQTALPTTEAQAEADLGTAQGEETDAGIDVEALKEQMGFYVDGVTLYDANGNPFVMRGVNHAHTWFTDKLIVSLDAIAGTGSNCVRIVLSDGEQWNKNSMQDVQNVIESCKERNLIAILEVHDATGYNDKESLLKAAQYFVDLKEILVGEEDYVIINIANEWQGNSTGKAWTEAYVEAIPMLREAGLAHTILVDSAGWGQYGKCIKEGGAEVFAADPLGNVMFAVHMYGTAGKTEEKIEQNLKYASDLGLCVCVGEFGYTHSDGDVKEEFLMQYCEDNAIGYIAWSWKGNSGGVEYLDLAVEWDGSVLSGDWGEIVVNGANGIRETSVICSVFSDAEESLFSACTYLTEDMYERALDFKEGDLTRIAAAMQKALAGEKVTVGVIGGSITQGSSASGNDKSYASLLKNWWEDTFPDAEIEFINAGVGGTNSYLGVHRVYEDLLLYEPDFVVVEFSVNDGNGPFYKKSYDNLVRRILKQENAPAVMLLFMTMEDGTSAQDTDASIGFQYGLPMISYRNAVLEEIKEGSFAWKDISPDNIHPNDRGHAIIGELFSVYLTDIYNRLDTLLAQPTPFETAAITREVYMEARILSGKDITPDTWGSFEESNANARFPDNFSTKTGEEGIVFTVEASNIGIMYQKMTDGDGGQYEVFVDGEYVMTLDADFSGGWGDYGETTEVFVSEEKKEHTVEIKKKEGSTGAAFAILGLLVS